VFGENEGFSEDYKDPGYWSGVPTFDRQAWENIKKEVDGILSKFNF
jgi:hypothetical protein